MSFAAKNMCVELMINFFILWPSTMSKHACAILPSTVIYAVFPVDIVVKLSWHGLIAQKNICELLSYRPSVAIWCEIHFSERTQLSFGHCAE